MGCISTALRRQNHCGRSVLSVPHGASMLQELAAQVSSISSKRASNTSSTSTSMSPAQAAASAQTSAIPPRNLHADALVLDPVFACVPQTSESTIDIDVEAQDCELCLQNGSVSIGARVSDPVCHALTRPPSSQSMLGAKNAVFSRNGSVLPGTTEPERPFLTRFVSRVKKFKTHQLPPQFLLPFKRTPQHRQDPPCERSRTTRPRLTSATRSSREATRASTRMPRRTSGAARAPRGGETSSRTARCRP